jgi:hypothetical protein
MAIRVVCPDCRSANELTDERDGSKVRCQVCGCEFDPVPRKTAKAGPPTATPAAEGQDQPASRRRRWEDDEEEPRYEHQKPADNSLGLVMVLAGVVIVLVILVLGAAAFFVVTPVAAPPAPVAAPIPAPIDSGGGIGQTAPSRMGSTLMKRSGTDKRSGAAKPVFATAKGGPARVIPAPPANPPAAKPETVEKTP